MHRKVSAVLSGYPESLSGRVLNPCDLLLSQSELIHLSKLGAGFNKSAVCQEQPVKQHGLKRYSKSIDSTLLGGKIRNEEAINS